MPNQELSGTTALVTGASRGFGRAIAIALSSSGAHVVGVAATEPGSKSYGRNSATRSPPSPPTR